MKSISKSKCCPIRNMGKTVPDWMVWRDLPCLCKSLLLWSEHCGAQRCTKNLLKLGCARSQSWTIVKLQAVCRSTFLFFFSFFKAEVQYIRELRRLIISVLGTLKSVLLGFSVGSPSFAKLRVAGVDRQVLDDCPASTHYLHLCCALGFVQYLQWSAKLSHEHAGLLLPMVSFYLQLMLQLRSWFLTHGFAISEVIFQQAAAGQTVWILVKDTGKLLTKLQQAPRAAEVNDHEQLLLQGNSTNASTDTEKYFPGPLRWQFPGKLLELFQVVRAEGGKIEGGERCINQNMA